MKTREMTINEALEVLKRTCLKRMRTGVYKRFPEGAMLTIGKHLNIISDDCMNPKEHWNEIIDSLDRHYPGWRGYEVKTEYNLEVVDHD